MSADNGPRVDVIVAATDARGTVLAGLDRFLDEVRGRGEVTLVDASADGTAVLAARVFPGLRVIRREPGALAPELWRDGLRATTAPLVAFSTAALVPCVGWLDALLGVLDRDDASAVGGPIVPGAGLDAAGRAVYLQRYSQYLPKPAGIGPTDPPGDNALYRRDRLAGLDALIADGFWECEVNRRLRARGGRTATAPDAVACYAGGVGLGAAVRQRYLHGRRFGAQRATAGSPAVRRLRSAATPLVPAVMLGRIVRSLRSAGEPLRPWLPALPALGALLVAWAAGEAVGLRAGGRRGRGAPTGSFAGPVDKRRLGSWGFEGTRREDFPMIPLGSAPAQRLDPSGSSGSRLLL